MTAGPLIAAALLLVATALPKLRHPEGATAMLSTLRIPVVPAVVRMWALGELVVGAMVLVVGGPLPTLLLAASYLVFAALVAGALRNGGVASCGCLGAVETPPSAAHLVVDVGAVLVALAAMPADIGSVRAVVVSQPLAGIPFLLLVAVTAYLAYLFMARFSSLVAFRARP
ncbi:MAG: hypothetical protein JWP02_3587 [Acidimicrobiales bacterium]|nr:hypothetical protein [Acidimicrobiales bacterium]